MLFRMGNEIADIMASGEPAHLREPQRGGAEGSPFLVVCEHASNCVPERYHRLGLSEQALASHIAWDPGAYLVAAELADLLSAPLVHGGLSRLLYDCNRPPEAPDAVPAVSEIYDIPGNTRLSEDEREQRVAQIYLPFRDRLSREIAARRASLAALVTVHSFTPSYRGERRSVEIGILHGQDPAFAEAMLARSPAENRFETRLNEPYSARDGVAHTLDAHGSANGLLNVMLEIRNDLIETPQTCAAMARLLAPWLGETLASLQKRIAS